MDNIALEIIDEHVEEGFVIDDDAKAEWALRKIAEERAETQRYINVCQTMINEYQAKIQKAQGELNNSTSYLKSLLAQYFETVPKQKTKTQETYKLPSGALKKKYLAPEFVRDDEKLLAWLKERNMASYIKVKESPDWAGLKKNVHVSGECVADENGEIIDGVKAVERPPVFEVEV
ncbi:host-nuclease inhibitor Gam family protein [Mahella australiensis]|uniref:Bacteriophage Mu Gam like protein n=1 Tax=Mahella australiensis (strain DSM 15567 / CIP 107919 / 50-1 BON) TaxID=697281 RepID=F3ZVG2_MAHA5|nr:host-nuclease inhibitor Gam family protein [Mahella australiensis]AEE95312.1 hypothetical protein Mahau_0089 [Mahella australiensis 50-1 BON]